MFAGTIVKHGFGCALAALLAGAMGPALAAGAGTSLPAIYTAKQAQAGAAVFANSCALCHGTAMQGGVGPALKGDAFHQMVTTQSLTAANLLTVVSLTMPQEAPASLTPEQYNQVVAYILQQNGYPAGNTPLTPGTPTLKTLQLK